MTSESQINESDKRALNALCAVPGHHLRATSKIAGGRMSAKAPKLVIAQHGRHLGLGTFNNRQTERRGWQSVKDVILYRVSDEMSQLSVAADHFIILSTPAVARRHIRAKYNGIVPAITDDVRSSLLHLSEICIGPRIRNLSRRFRIF